MTVKEAIIITSCIAALIILPLVNSLLPHGWFDMLIHPPQFVELELEQVAFSYFEPTGDIPAVRGVGWDVLVTQNCARDLAQRFDLVLPDIDLETEMFIVSFGSELKRLDFDLNEPRYRRLGEFIGFPVFSRNYTYDLIVVYRTDKIRITHADGAGFRTPYMGRGRGHGPWSWEYSPRRNPIE